MLAQAVVAFFKHKVVSSIIVLACWPPIDQIKFTRQLSQYGMSATFSCDPAILDHIRHHYLQGVLYLTHENDDMPMFKKIKKTHFMMKYKWLILGDHVPDVLSKIRYDCDVAFLKWNQVANNKTKDFTDKFRCPPSGFIIRSVRYIPLFSVIDYTYSYKAISIFEVHDQIITIFLWDQLGSNIFKIGPQLIDREIALTVEARTAIHIYDTYVHPRDGIAINLWGYWTNSTGLVLTHERDRILRRNDLKRYPLRIATPVGHYSSDKYDGSFVDFLEDETMSDQDPGIRSGYRTAVLLTEAVNAQDVLIQNELWAAVINNNSMYVMVSTGEADISGAILRILWERTFVLDFIIPIWPFRWENHLMTNPALGLENLKFPTGNRQKLPDYAVGCTAGVFLLVGFTYLSERESSSNMYLEPFSPAVWWSCLAMMTILAIVERITSKSPKEKDGALYTVLTTWLQQDASAVPEGGSGRFAFTVLSVSAMLVHAYYSSAIISALMSTGRGGPDSLKALGDSKYAIGSEDYDYIRYLFFDVKTTWDDLEYLKKKKMTPYFYQELERGVELIRQGSTAFHSEYNQIYPHFKTFSDEQICKLQHVDTIPEVLTWILATKDGQWSEVLRTAGGWVLETGLGKRLVNRLRVPQPPCRASLLAERVKLGDIAPLLALTAFGAFLSVVLLGVEIMFAKAKKGKLREGVAKLASEDDDGTSEFTEYQSNIE